MTTQAPVGQTLRQLQSPVDAHDYTLQRRLPTLSPSSVQRPVLAGAVSHGAPDARELLGATTACPGYELITPIATGSTATVWQARQIGLSRAVVVKRLHDQLRDIPWARFELKREGWLLAKLSSPHTVRIYDVVEEGERGELFLVLEHVHGELLHGRRPVPFQAAVEAVLQLCDAVGECHANGYVHGDIAADNVIRCLYGKYKLLDFGSAVPFSRQSDDLHAARNRQATPQADVRSLGLLAYLMLTGRSYEQEPAGTRPTAQTVRRRAAQPDPWANLPFAVPERLQSLILKCIDDNPAHRPQSAAMLAAQLRACLRA